MKLIIFILGIAIGGAGGVVWSSKNKEMADKLSPIIEQRVLEAKIELTKKFNEKLTQIAATTPATPPKGSSSFFGGSSAAAPSNVTAIKSLQSEQESELAALEKQLAATKK